MQQVAANGLKVAFFESGRATDRLVILLHGFPDTAHTWHDVRERIAQRGFRVVAPFMRGYAPTTAPADRDYSAVRLGEDVLALMTALERRSAIVVGHDWGAFAAYAAANLAPERVEKLVTLAIPHPRALSPLSLWKARHFIAFQFRASALANLKRDNFAEVDAIWRRWSPGYAATTAELDAVKLCLSTSAEHALGYYWSFPLDTLSLRARRVLLAKTSVPTLSMFGDDDGALDLTGIDATKRAFTGAYELVRIPKVGHFIHREAPDTVIDNVLRFV